MIALKLATLEYVRAGTRRAPGGRDFLWLTLLVFFLQLMAMLILSAREGVLERSVDAFLGKRDGYGIPVWTVPNIFGSVTPVMVSNNMVDEISNAGFYAAPFRRLHNAQLIRLPAQDVWRVSRPGQTANFSGMAADFDGPIYPQKILEPSGPPLPDSLDGAWEIVLDETLFRRHFDLDAYRTALMGQVPDSFMEQVPSDMSRLTEMSVIWLNVRVRRTERLTPFRVNWGQHFGIGSRETAFIVPLEMYNLYQIAKNNERLCAFIEGGPSPADRVLSLRSGRVFTMSAEERAAFSDKLESLSTSLGGELIDAGSRIRLDFGADSEGLGECEQGVSGLMVQLFLDETGMTLEPDQFSTRARTSPLIVAPDRIEMPCEILNSSDLSRARQIERDGACIAALPTADSETGFSDLLVYADGRPMLRPLVDFLSCRQTQDASERQFCVPVSSEGGNFESRLSLHEIYRDSLNRFSFLTGLLKAVTVPVGSVMLLVLAAILWVQLGTIIGHRRVRYAMLLSNGLSWGQVKFMVVFQGIMAVTVSMIAAFSFIFIAKAAMVPRMREITQTYESITLGELIDVLPVTPQIVGIVYLATLLGTVILTVVQTRLNGIRPSSPLERLLQ